MSVGRVSVHRTLLTMILISSIVVLPIVVGQNSSVEDKPGELANSMLGIGGTKEEGGDQAQPTDSAMNLETTTPKRKRLFLRTRAKTTTTTTTPPATTIVNPEEETAANPAGEMAETGAKGSTTPTVPQDLSETEKRTLTEALETEQTAASSGTGAKIRTSGDTVPENMRASTMNDEAASTNQDSDTSNGATATGNDGTATTNTSQTNDGGAKGEEATAATSTTTAASNTESEKAGTSSDPGSDTSTSTAESAKDTSSSTTVETPSASSTDASTTSTTMAPTTSTATASTESTMTTATDPPSKTSSTPSSSTTTSSDPTTESTTAAATTERSTNTTTSTTTPEPTTSTSTTTSTTAEPTTSTSTTTSTTPEPTTSTSSTTSTTPEPSTSTSTTTSTTAEPTTSTSTTTTTTTTTTTSTTPEPTTMEPTTTPLPYSTIAPGSRPKSSRDNDPTVSCYENVLQTKCGKNAVNLFNEKFNMQNFDSDVPLYMLDIQFYCTDFRNSTDGGILWWQEIQKDARFIPRKWRYWVGNQLNECNYFIEPYINFHIREPGLASVKIVDVDKGWHMNKFVDSTTVYVCFSSDNGPASKRHIKNVLDSFLYCLLHYGRGLLPDLD